MGCPFVKKTGLITSFGSGFVKIPDFSSFMMRFGFDGKVKKRLIIKILHKKITHVTYQ